MRLVGSTVESVGRHGKNFWMRMQTASKVPMVMMMHFGMTGMIKMRDVHSHMVFMENGGDKKALRRKQLAKAGLLEGETATNGSKTGSNLLKDVKVTAEVDSAQSDAESEVASGETPWPPRFTKFELHLTNASQNTSIDWAFTDARRLGRVRFLYDDECTTDETLFSVAPLKSLGPDYSKKPEVQALSEPFVRGDPDPHHHGRPRPPFEQFARLILTKKKPIKALLLDQEHFAGVGNWVADEILYHSRLYPGDVISQKVSDPQSPVLRKLYDSILFVMEESVRVEGNVHELPDDWLMLYRWGKGRSKERAVTNLGYKVDFETVGGRTSCYIKELQKPLKREANNVKNEDTALKKEGGEEIALKEVEDEEEDYGELTVAPKRRKTAKRGKSVKREEEDEVDDEYGLLTVAPKRQKPTKRRPQLKKEIAVSLDENDGSKRRRSKRVSQTSS